MLTRPPPSPRAKAVEHLRGSSRTRWPAATGLHGGGTGPRTCAWPTAARPRPDRRWRPRFTSANSRSPSSSSMAAASAVDMASSSSFSSSSTFLRTEAASGQAQPDRARLLRHPAQQRGQRVRDAVERGAAALPALARLPRGDRALVALGDVPGVEHVGVAVDHLGGHPAGDVVQGDSGPPPLRPSAPATPPGTTRRRAPSGPRRGRRYSRPRTARRVFSHVGPQRRRRLRPIPRGSRRAPGGAAPRRPARRTPPPDLPAGGITGRGSAFERQRAGSPVPTAHRAPGPSSRRRRAQCATRTRPRPALRRAATPRRARSPPPPARAARGSSPAGSPAAPRPGAASPGGASTVASIRITPHRDWPVPGHCASSATSPPAAGHVSSIGASGGNANSGVARRRPAGSAPRADSGDSRWLRQRHHAAPGLHHAAERHPVRHLAARGRWERATPEPRAWPLPPRRRPQEGHQRGRRGRPPAGPPRRRHRRHQGHRGARRGPAKPPSGVYSDNTSAPAPAAPATPAAANDASAALPAGHAGRRGDTASSAAGRAHHPEPPTSEAATPRPPAAAQSSVGWTGRQPEDAANHVIPAVTPATASGAAASAQRCADQPTTEVPRAVLAQPLRQGRQPKPSRRRREQPHSGAVDSATTTGRPRCQRASGAVTSTEAASSTSAGFTAPSAAGAALPSPSPLRSRPERAHHAQRGLAVAAEPAHRAQRIELTLAGACVDLVGQRLQHVDARTPPALTTP